MNKRELSKMISEAVHKALKENLDMPPVTDDQLDDATQLLMMVSGRIMAAQNTPVSGDVIAQAVHHIEQADGILAKAGLKADAADISDISESKKPVRSKYRKS